MKIFGHGQSHGPFSRALHLPGGKLANIGLLYIILEGIYQRVKVNVPNFGGLSGSEDRGGGDNSIQFTNFGRVGDKNFKEWRQKLEGGGGRVVDDKILTFSSHCTR